MAELAEVVENIQDDFPFSSLRDFNHNGLEMNPRLVLIDETCLSELEYPVDLKKNIKLILYPDTGSTSTSVEYQGDIGDPR